MDKEKWSRLENLKHLFEEGFLSASEFENRKSQLIDELTGTSLSRSSSLVSTTTSILSGNTTSNSMTNQNTASNGGTHWKPMRRMSSANSVEGVGNEQTGGNGGKGEGEGGNGMGNGSGLAGLRLQEEVNVSKAVPPPLPPPIVLNLPPRTPQVVLPIVVARPPPLFADIPTELANKYTYEPETRRWVKSQTKVKIDPTPFARGALRFVYHIKDLSSFNEPYVAKMSIDPRDNFDRTVYFKDVEMQSVARLFAQKFNTYDVPKRVDFVDAWLIELVQRPGNPMYFIDFSTRTLQLWSGKIYRRRI